MRVRCPHCHNPIEIVDDAALSNIECLSCGSSFNLVESGTATYSEHGKRISHFQLVQRLGSGAFGTVWKAKDTKLQRFVAIKLPRKQNLTNTESEKFLREARSSSQLRHPNIVSVHEVGRENGQLFIISDYIEGVTLADWLTQGRPSCREGSELCQRIAEAIHHAHERGVIHRDLKPSNIILDADGQPHVMDFGLAKREAGEITMTLDGEVLGTPAYMSPEQALGLSHTADKRSDVYSLSAILFEILTGERPFRGSARMVLHQVANDDPPSPRKLNNNVPRDLETICLKGLRKEPEKRYADAVSLAQDLERWQQGQPILARPVGRIERTTKWCRRNPVASWSLLLISSLVILLCIALAYAFSAKEALIRSEADKNHDQAQTIVDSLVNANAQAVPYVLKSLEPLSDFALPIIRARLSTNPDQLGQLRLLLGLAALGRTEDLDRTLHLGLDAPPNEPSNIIAALMYDREKALVQIGTLISDTHNNQDWNRKSRLAILALHLGDPAYAASMLHTAGQRHPFERTAFIETFSNWHGDISQLANLTPEILHLVQDESQTPDLMSGICLSLGGVANVEDEGGVDWTLLEDWYTTASHGRVRSASRWALVKMNRPLPSSETASEHLPKRDWLVNSVGSTMIRVSPGELSLDDGRILRIDSPYFMSIHQVTVEQFRDFLGDENYKRKYPDEVPVDGDFTTTVNTIGRLTFAQNPGPDHPIEGVSWNDAVMYLNWLSYKEGRSASYYPRTFREPIAGEDNQILPGKEMTIWEETESKDGYRLPTDMEWEYAQRAMAKTTFAHGNDESLLTRYAVYGVHQTSPCGSKLPNAWGFFDMPGNVPEWCNDPAGDAQIDGVRPRFRDAGERRRVVRGIHYFERQLEVTARQHFRDEAAPSRRMREGFRIVLSATN